jgi:nucleoside-diphosphate-sugar epimerase
VTRVLLTGATGSFGRYLAWELLARGCEVVALARGRDEADARRRVLGAVRPASAEGLLTICGDVTEPGLGLADRALIRTCELALHSAATTEFGLPLEAARRSNLAGTLNVLAVLRSLARLEAVGHVGTAFVAGRRTGRIYEDELHHTAGFVNTYERSKYEAEVMVRASGLPLSVFRPSVIAEDEPTKAPSALRFALQLIARGLLPVLPSPEQATFDVIGARDAAAAAVELLLTQPPGGVYHVAGGDDAPLLSDVVAAGAGRRPVLLDPPAFERELARLEARFPTARPVYAGLRTFVGVLAHPKVFDTRVAETALGRPVARTDPLTLVGRTLEAAA